MPTDGDDGVWLGPWAVDGSGRLIPQAVMMTHDDTRSTRERRVGNLTDLSQVEFTPWILRHRTVMVVGRCKKGAFG